jgi:hypothetical protein
MQGDLVGQGTQGATPHFIKKSVWIQGSVFGARFLDAIEKPFQLNSELRNCLWQHAKSSQVRTLNDQNRAFSTTLNARWRVIFLTRLTVSLFLHKRLAQGPLRVLGVFVFTQPGSLPVSEGSRDLGFPPHC